jgi:hypothetical protein
MRVLISSPMSPAASASERPNSSLNRLTERSQKMVSVICSVPCLAGFR